MPSRGAHCCMLTKVAGPAIQRVINQQAFPAMVPQLACSCHDVGEAQAPLLTQEPADPVTMSKNRKQENPPTDFPPRVLWGTLCNQ